MIQEKRPIRFPNTYKVELGILDGGSRCKIKGWTDRTHVHRFPKDVVIGNIFAVDVDLPLLSRIIM